MTRLAWLVPAARQAEWLEEWYSELCHAREAALARGESEARTRWRLRLRTTGALSDAVWLRGLSVRPRGGSLREGTRVLRRQPGFVLMVVGTLALGIGAATAVFSVVDALLLRPLPYRDADRLVLLSDVSGSVFTRYESADFAQVWRARSEVFEAIHAFSDRSVTLTRPGEPRRLSAHLLEPGVLSALGVAPILGREFAPEESAPGRDRVVLLSHREWRSGFAGDRGVVGTTVYLDDEPFTVVGVMPPSLRMLPGGVPDIALPLPDTLQRSGSLVLLGRLRDDLPLQLAQEKVDAVAARLDADEPREGGWGVRLTPFGPVVSDATQRGLAVLSGAVSLLLLVSCVNVAGLLFVRGVARRPELAIRRALGASGAALFRQALAESLVLALLSGAAGVALAWWGVRALMALAPSWLIQFSYNPVTMDGRVLAFALALSLATGVAFGLAPALRALRTGPLGVGHRSTAGSRETTRLRAVVHALQIALAVMLLAGAAVLGRSFFRLAAVDLGFDPNGLVVLSYDLPEFRYPEESQRDVFSEALDARLRALPGVEGVSWSLYAMIGWMGIDATDGFETDDGAPPVAQGGQRSGSRVVSGSVQSPKQLVPFARVDSAYFEVMGIPLLDGRAFTDADARDGSGSVIIDTDLAHRLWPSERAVGRRFRLSGEDRPWLTVVGVTVDVKLEAPDDPYGPYVIFYPTNRERMSRSAGLILRARDPTVLAAALPRVLRSLDPGLVVRVWTATELWGGTIQLPRFLLLVMTVFAATALLLAAIGVYGLVAFTVATRAREIGIRVVVGARRVQVVGSVFGRGFLISAAGLALGLAGALVFSRFLSALLYETSPLDGRALALVGAVVALSSAAALIAPALRAAKVDPAEALRSE